MTRTLAAALLALAAAAPARADRILFTSERTPAWGRSRLVQVSPGGGARTLAVAPEEGAAFSPDGRLVAWPADGARTLLLQASAGGPVREVGSFPGRIGDLEWSPDGKRIAFDVTPLGGIRQLWLADTAGGPPRELAERAHEPSWSPDGRTLAAATASALVLVDPAGGATRTLAYSASSGTWSPDGRRLAYVVDGDLHVVDRHGGGRRRLAVNADQPVWSPDGRRLAFVRGMRIGIVDLGGGTRLVAAARDVTLGAWTRAGIVFESRASDRSRPHVRLLSGRRIRTLATEAANTGVRDFHGFRFVVERSASDPTEVWSMRPDGSDARPLTHDDVYDENPAASPDGRWIAYDRPAHEATYDEYELWIVRGDGRRAHRVLRHLPYGIDDEPTWSPDGRWIAFARMARSSFQIYAVHPDGTGLRRVTHERQDAGHPAWSPDGASIAYDCWGDAGPSVCTIRPDGSGRTRIGLDYSSSAAWSPDGTRLAWEHDRRIEIARRDGGDVRQLVRGEHPSWSPDGTRLAYVRDDGFDSAGFLHVAVHTVALDGSGDATITSSLEFADQPFWSR